jgi:hypothetical protein
MGIPQLKFAAPTKVKVGDVAITVWKHGKLCGFWWVTAMSCHPVSFTASTG